VELLYIFDIYVLCDMPIKHMTASFTTQVFQGIPIKYKDW